MYGISFELKKKNVLILILISTLNFSWYCRCVGVCGERGVEFEV